MRGISRPDLYVVARVLEALYEHPDGMKRTPLQQATGLNYTVFARYLELLAARGLVAVETAGPDPPLVRLTPKGAGSLRYLTEGISAIAGTASVPGEPGAGHRAPAES